MKLICNTRICVCLFVLILIILTMCIFFFLPNRDNTLTPIEDDEDSSTELELDDIKIPEPVARQDNHYCRDTGELSESKNGNISVDFKNSFKNCGNPMEGCDHLDSNLDYMQSPMYCRCDHKCVEYGDCCVTVLREIKEINVDPVWRCVKLPNSEHGVRMISKCPAGSSNETVIDRERCENLYCDDDETLCSWLDIPVLHNETRDLYRNIYCARCHGVLDTELYKIHRTINCKKVGNWEEFKSRAAYYKGQLKWKGTAEVICEMEIPEFLPDSIQKFVPEVRFCPNPLVVNETCGICLENEENKLLYQLCHSYMQVVSVPVTPGETFGMLFKNAHCAKCNFPHLAKTKITRTGQCYRLPSRQRFFDESLNKQSEPSTTGSPTNE
ncbi:unnamed protein product [Orchesella dallaii]|uniref:SMB domain-containing protein n=1 Tax=Orchesella dallaii TaxID=48710 RepID=A0ABP1R0Y3_9HEXA